MATIDEQIEAQRKAAAAAEAEIARLEALREPDAGMSAEQKVEEFRSVAMTAMESGGPEAAAIRRAVDAALKQTPARTKRAEV